MAGYLVGGQKPKARYVGDGTTARKIKKRIVGNGVAAIVTWVNTIARQGILKDGTQALAASGTWERVTGFKLDPAYPDTDAAAPGSDGLFVSGRASFIVEGTIATSSTSSVTRGVRIVSGGATLAEYSAGGSSAERTVSIVMPDATDTSLELHAQVSSSTASTRTLAADSTKLSYRTGSYYEQLVDLTVVRNVATETPLTPNELAELPHVPGSGIYLEAGTYQLTWNLYSVGWGTDWRVGARFGGSENQVQVIGASGNAWNRIIQTITVPSPQYVTPTVASSNSSYLQILAGRLNLFISKI